MKTSKINKLNYSESLEIESALSHILARYNKHSHAGAGNDFRVVDTIMLSADESSALSKLHDIIQIIKITSLSHAEILKISSVLFHIVTRYKMDSRPVFDFDHHLLESVVIFADQYAALTKLHDIFYNKLYVY